MFGCSECLNTAKVELIETLLLMRNNGAANGPPNGAEQNSEEQLVTTVRIAGPP